MVAALYRRYRPEAFAEMIGQSQVTEPLMTALRTGRIGHAYLFSGPRGCGKTTSARILARCLNCAEGPTDTPCGTCPSCVELSRDGGGSLDVVEIDAASHGGVDDARDLRERAVFAPARDRFKIFIIDEAHMVTPGGFNALLKIVEEPPPHVKFIFATTEPDKVIGTIRSRTHHYPFRLIAPGTLIDYIQSLCDSEGVQVEPGVLPLVVRAGGGSVRDTLSILDQLIAGSETSVVTAERAAGLLGFTHTELLDDVVVAFGAHDAAAAFQATDRVVQTGQDPRRFVEDLLERLRDLIVVSATTVDGAAAVFRGVPQDQLTRMFEQSQSFARGELSRIADTVSSGLDKMAGATAPRLQLELMIARALVVQEQNASRSAATSGGATAPGVHAPAPPAQRGAAPSAPTQQQPALDPLAALAAARGAVVAPQPSVAQSPAASPDSLPPEGAKQTAPGTPNAAQTAASIREFLREEPHQHTQSASGPPESAPVSADRAAEPAPAPQPPQTPRPAAGTASAPHPNEGAASFGRPISDILSTSQIASIGSETPPPANQASPENAPQAQAQPQAPANPAETTSSAMAGAESAAASPSPTGPEGEPDASGVPSAGASADGDTGPEGDVEAAESGLEDLLELWPDLLEEILERDREAWNAVRPVTPMGLEGEVLTIGLASQSDLAAFKTTGAGPLRETIMSAIGISVKYVPKRLPEGGSGPQPQAGAREPQSTSAGDAEEPHQAGSSQQDDPMQRAAARLSALGPALAAPAWADPPPTPPTSSETSESVADEPPAAERVPTGPNAAEPFSGKPAAPESDPIVGDYVEPADDPYGEGDPFAGSDPYTDGVSPGPSATAQETPVPEPAETRAAPATAAIPGVAPAAPLEASREAKPSAAPTTEPPLDPESERPRAAPAFTRYGEAVVREVLGARFIEERPLPPRLEG